MGRSRLLALALVTAWTICGLALYVRLIQPWSHSSQDFNEFSGGNAVDGFGSNHQCRNFDDLYHWAERMHYNDETDAERLEEKFKILNITINYPSKLEIL